MSTAKVNEEQVALWNGVSGQAWVDAQAVIEQMFEPITQSLVAAARDEAPSNVLDVGCGTGSTTCAIARMLDEQRGCLGVDISGAMIEVARRRAEQEQCAARFLQSDAQTHDFARASFDLIVSRFGVMFFDDSVAAFANLRRAARAGALLRFIAWRSAAENPFMTTAETAAAPLLPSIPARQADAPGQFALAKEERIRQMLEGSGWEQLQIRPIEVSCVFPAPQLELYVTRFGPLGRVLHDADLDTRQRVTAVVRAAFERYVDEGHVRFEAACWMVDARCPSS